MSRKNIFGLISGGSSRRSSLSRNGSAGTSLTTSLRKIPEENGLNGNANLPPPSPLVRFPGIFSARMKSTNEKRTRSISRFVRNAGGSKSFFKNVGPDGVTSEQAHQFWIKNRKIGDDALSASLSAIYAKLLVVLGVAMPVTEILTGRISPSVYQGFYVYLYVLSIIYVIFVYAVHISNRSNFSLVKTYQDKTEDYSIGKKTPHFGSFYLRVGAISFGIGAMVYSGLEFGQYFEMNDRHRNEKSFKKKQHHFGSFFLRVGAIAFSIGSMVYSGLEFGQYFEINNPICHNIFIALTPATRMALSIVQMQFIFLNTVELDMARHKVISRFGLMHIVATNLCEWFYVLVEETKHEIHHFAHDHEMAKLLTPSAHFSLIAANKSNNSAIVENIFNLNETDIENVTTVKPNLHETLNECERTNIMGTLVQNSSPFLFPCTIEYSLICAVIVYEMWKKIKSIPDIERHRKNAQKKDTRVAHHFTVDCARAHKGMFAGILIVVLTIICLIMYFVLHDEPNYENLAILEVTISEILLYSVTSLAVIAAVIRMRDLKYLAKTSDHHASSITLDCTLLVLSQTGVYVYGLFSIIGNYFSIEENYYGGEEGLAAEILSLLQTSIQTLFILNASWRRCRGAKQHRIKPGREIVTFLLVANMSIWCINTLVKGHAGFRPSHLNLYGIWAWTVITHVSMPLAIFYRFHSTICLFEIWKSAYKAQ